MYISGNQQINNIWYRFGFNGMEADDEVYGVTGSSYTAEFWQYDSRLGRRWNLDPEPQISISDYATFKNSPIILTDPLGNSADWYKNDKGNVIWRDSHDATYEGEQGTYENIGTTYSQKLADGSYANYYQNELVGYTEKGKYNFKSTNAKSYLLGNKSPLSKENQSEYYNGLVRGAGKQFIENGGWMVGAAMVSPFIIGAAITYTPFVVAATKSTAIANTGFAVADGITQYTVTGDVDILSVGMNYAPGGKLFKLGKYSKIAYEGMKVGLDAAIDINNDGIEINTGREILINSITGSMNVGISNITKGTYVGKPLLQTITTSTNAALKERK